MPLLVARVSMRMLQLTPAICNWEGGTLSQTGSNDVYELLFVCKLTGQIHLWMVEFHQSLGGLLKFFDTFIDLFH